MDKKFLTIKELSTYLNLKISNVRMMVFRGEIHPIRFGRLLRFDLSEIENWLKSKKN